MTTPPSNSISCWAIPKCRPASGKRRAAGSALSLRTDRRRRNNGRACRAGLEQHERQSRDHRPAERRQVDAVQPAGRAQAGARRRRAGRHPRSPRGRGPDRGPVLHHRRHRRPRGGRSGNARRPHARADGSGAHRLRRDPVRGRRARRRSPPPTSISRKRCAAPASRSSSSPTRRKAPRGRPASTRCSGSALASRSPSPPSTARA